MKVILTGEDPKLGKKGDVTEVSPGFARNFLLPRGFAVAVTAGALKEIEGRNAAKARSDEKEEARAKGLASKIQGLELKFERASAKDNKLFGSLTVQAVVAALKEKGVEVSKRQVIFSGAVRSSGQHSAQVKLHPKVTATIRISVEGKKPKA